MVCRWTNCLDPNINIFRDPRWGRGSETFGEDPYLTSRMVAAYIRGLQWGTIGPQGISDVHNEIGFATRADVSRVFMKAAATCKHFAAHSLDIASTGGWTRFDFNAVVDERWVPDIVGLWRVALRTGQLLPPLPCNVLGSKARCPISALH
jgi:hypothetical protein